MVDGAPRFWHVCRAWRGALARLALGDRRSRRASPSSLSPAGLTLFLVLALMLFAAPAWAGAFTKGPYIQGLGQTAVTIKLELAEAASAPVSIELSVEPASPPQGRQAPQAPQAPLAPQARVIEAPAPSSGLVAVRVDGLTPATSYTYVAAFGGVKSEPGRFTTAPFDDRPFRFLVYGDSRSDHAAHAAVVRQIEATPSDFLVHTGDMVQRGNSAEDWQAFFDVERSLLRDRCLFASVGNHELTSPDIAGEIAFIRYFGADSRGSAATGAVPAAEAGSARAPLYGSFRWSNARFFLLNAMDTWTGAERDWLRDELDRSQREPGVVHRFAVLHHGPFSSGRHGPNKRLVDANVPDLLRESGVDLVIAGHDHLYERGEGGGLKYVISGGAGAPLYPRGLAAPETQAFESVHHFLELAVDGDLVSMSARRASGGIIERCTFKARGPWDCDRGSSVAAASSSSSKGSSSCGCEVVGASPSSPLGAPPVGAAALAAAAALRRSVIARRIRRMVRGFLGGPCRNA